MTTDTLHDLSTRLRHFTQERGWERFHDPKSLTLALVGEVGELAELFQWIPADEATSTFHEPDRQRRAAEEMSDILIYLTHLANVLDIDLAAAAHDKLDAADRRYPPTHGTHTPAPVKP